MALNLNLEHVKIIVENVKIKFVYYFYRSTSLSLILPWISDRILSPFARIPLCLYVRPDFSALIKNVMFLEYTIWHTTNAICCFSAKTLVTWVRLCFVCCFMICDSLQSAKCHHLQTTKDMCQCVSPPLPQHKYVAFFSLFWSPIFSLIWLELLNALEGKYL